MWKCPCSAAIILIEGDIGCNWRANTWIPTNYMTVHGLVRYGYINEARMLADKTAELVNKAGNGEYFVTETGEGQGLKYSGDGRCWLISCSRNSRTVSTPRWSENTVINAAAQINVSAAVFIQWEAQCHKTERFLNPWMQSATQVLMSTMCGLQTVLSAG